MSDIDMRQPFRLRDIIPIAFPHGGITVAGLRKEAYRGRLRIMRIAGKDFTTLGDIEEMMRRCVVDQPNRQQQEWSEDRGKIALAAARRIANDLRQGQRTSRSRSPK